MSTDVPLHVIIVRYDAVTLVRQLAATLARQSTIASVVVVDHGPDVLADIEGGSVVRPNKNNGFGGGVNVGLGYLFSQKLGADDLVVVLNPDVHVSQQFGEQWQHFFKSQPTHVLASPWMGEVDWLTGKAHILTQSDIAGRGRSLRRWPYVHGACLAARWQTWQRLQGMESRYFLYWEDVELSWRAEQRGIQLTQSSGVVVDHDHEASSARTSDKTYYLVRNAVVCGQQFARGGRQLWWWFLTRLRLAYHLRPRADARVRSALLDALEGQLGPRVT